MTEPASASLSGRTARGMLRRWAMLSWWARIAVVYAASRLVTTAMLIGVGQLQGVGSRFAEHPDLETLSSGWDGQWYWLIAVSGYPSTIPLDAGGHVAESAWAFLPIYPGLARVLSIVTFLPWPAAAVLLSLGCGFGTALLFYRLMRTRLPRSSANFAVVLLCIAPLSPLFQFAYAEALSMLLLTLALLLLVRRRYAWLLAVVPVMAFTRPGILAFAVLMGLHLIVRIATRRREPFPPAQFILVLAVGALAAVSGFAWMVIAGIATGMPDAYLQTELAWRAAFIGFQPLVPFTAWFQAGAFWFGAPLGQIIVVVLVILAGIGLFTPWVKRIGVDLRLWVASYLVYLFAVFFPQTSVFRLLVPVFPLLGAVAVPRSRSYRAGVVLGSLALQWIWLYVMYGLANAYWTIP